MHFRTVLVLSLIAWSWSAAAPAKELIHDAEYYILKAQNGDRWKPDDATISRKLSELRENNGGKVRSEA
jgi:arylsulfatase